MKIINEDYIVNIPRYRHFSIGGNPDSAEVGETEYRVGYYSFMDFVDRYIPKKDQSRIAHEIWDQMSDEEQDRIRSYEYDPNLIDECIADGDYDYLDEMLGFYDYIADNITHLGYRHEFLEYFDD